MINNHLTKTHSPRFDEELVRGKVAYCKKLPNGSYQVSWFSSDGRGWKDKIIWGEFNAHQWAHDRFPQVIDS